MEQAMGSLSVVNDLSVCLIQESDRRASVR